MEPERLVQWQRLEGATYAKSTKVDKFDPIFPVRLPFDHTARRWLLIGPRHDGSLYGKYEREVLSALAEPLAAALRYFRQQVLIRYLIDRQEKLTKCVAIYEKGLPEAES